MTMLLSYCLKLSISLALVSLFYHFVLRKLTFYTWNRYYLFGYSLLSMLVAFIDISPVLQQMEWNTIHFVELVPAVGSNNILTTHANAHTYLTASNVMGVLLITGVFFMALRLLFQFSSFKRLAKKSELMSVEGIRFYQVNHSIIPFSFGNSIFINCRQHSEQELREIIRHEFVHVKQKHSIDIMWAEMLCMFNWYNPFAWLLKAHIRQNLEFIADKQVLQSGVNRRQYQYLLLKVVGNNQFSIASKFNFASLKKRIAMMNRSKSSRLNLVRFLFILPLVVVLLLAFRNKRTKNISLGKNDRIAIAMSKKARIDTIPKSSRARAQASNENILSTVSDDFEITDDRAVIHLKNGTTEEYDLKNKEQRKKFEDKYGKITSTSAHKGPMATVSAVTADGVVTTVAPVSVISAASATGIGDGNGNGVTSTTVNSNVSTVVSVSASNKKAVAVNVDVPAAATVIAPAARLQTAVAITGDEGDLIAVTPEVLFTIYKTMTRQQLEEIKTQMKEKGFDLNINEAKYNDNGRLTSINGTIESKDAKARFSGSGFNKIIVSVIKDGSRVYFRVDEQHAVKRVI